jgi:flagellar basal-body rod modification protein FlgD
MELLPTQNASLLTGAHALDSSASSSSTASSSSSNSASITSNDFLQLLVTEMQNQDPTASTDPNEYINQLVQVNSLQQLIQINQDLGGSSSSASGSAAGAASGAASGAAVASKAGPAAASSPVPGIVAGNLSAPSPDNAATRVAEALGAPSPSNNQYQSLLNALKSRAHSAPPTNLTAAH